MGKIGQNTNRIESKPTNHALSPKHIKINFALAGLLATSTYAPSHWITNSGSIA